MKNKKLLKRIAAVLLSATLVAGGLTVIQGTGGVFGNTAIMANAAAVHTASTLDEFLTAINNASDGDRIRLTDSFTVDDDIEINANNESKTITVDFDGNRINFDGEEANKIQSYLYINNANLHIIFMDSGFGGGLVALKNRIVRLLLIKEGTIEFLSGIYTGGLDITRTDTRQASVYVKGGYFDLLDEDYDGPFYKDSSGSVVEVSGGYFTERSNVSSVSGQCREQCEVYNTGFSDYTKGVRSVDGKDVADIAIEDIAGQPYTGTKIIPALNLTDGTKKLTENIDYTVSYEDNLEVGTATAYISGIGNYFNTITKTFNVVKATPAYTIPSGLKATYGQTLREISLPKGWSWEKPSQSVGNAGTNTLKAIFVPEDTEHYRTVEGIGIAVEVAHLITAVDSKPASCTEDGNTAYWQDETGQKYSDANGLNAVSDESVVIPATGHSYGNPTWTWANDYQSAAASFTCNKSDDTKVVKASVTSGTTKATCVKDGSIVYTGKVTFENKTYTDTRTVVLPHSPDYHEYIESVVEPTKTEKGYTLHTCTICGDSYKDNYTEYVQPDLVNHSTISKSSVPQNTSVFVKGAAEGGEGSYKYAFYYKKSTSPAWATIGELYGNTTEVSFVPATVAKYLVKVNVKDETGKIVTKIYEVNSTKPTGDDLVNKSTLDKTTTQRGTPITITGAASGGKGGYTYAFYYKKTTSKAFTAIGTEYGTATTATFTPASSAEYNVRINVKDSNGTIVTKQYKITATAANTLTNNSTISAEEVTKGTAVTLTGNASGGTAPYKYAFYYKKSASSSWTKIGTEFGTDTVSSFTPAMKATYNVKIVAQDNTGKTAEKTFTVTSK